MRNVFDYVSNAIYIAIKSKQLGYLSFILALLSYSACEVFFLLL